MNAESNEQSPLPASTAASTRQAWTTPELVELDIWSETGVKGVDTTEGATTKPFS